MMKNDRVGVLTSSAFSLQVSAFKFQPSLFLLLAPPWMVLCGETSDFSPLPDTRSDILFKFCCIAVLEV